MARSTQTTARQTDSISRPVCHSASQPIPPVRTLRSGLGSALIEGNDAQPTGYAEHDGHAERRRPMS
jgi:hypothetical protein